MQTTHQVIRLLLDNANSQAAAEGYKFRYFTVAYQDDLFAVLVSNNLLDWHVYTVPVEYLHRRYALWFVKALFGLSD